MEWIVVLLAIVALNLYDIVLLLQGSCPSAERPICGVAWLVGTVMQFVRQNESA